MFPAAVSWSLSNWCGAARQSISGMSTGVSCSRLGLLFLLTLRCCPLLMYLGVADGGIKSQYVRDASGQLIGLMELGEPYYPVVARSLRFMLTWLQTWEQEAGGYAPHVMVGNPPALDKIVGVDVIDQADDTFYLISAWGRYTELSGDHSLETAFYPLLRNFTRHYCAGGARSTGSKGTEGHGGVPYFNTTLSLLWNPNLEHRCASSPTPPLVCCLPAPARAFAPGMPRKDDFLPTDVV